MSSPSAVHLQLRSAALAPKELRSGRGFCIRRVESTVGLEDRVVKSSSVPGLLVSMSLRPIALGSYQLWMDQKQLPSRSVAAYRTNIIDYDASPSCWAGTGFDYVHYHVPRATLDQLSDDMGFGRVGTFRPAALEHDIVLAQLTRSALPFIGGDDFSTLALDRFELILGAHLLQHYGGHRRALSAPSGGRLSPWQKRRAEELIASRLDGALRLADLASACGVSVGHFARLFKASFGMSTHRWLSERRIERAKDALLATREPLNEIASRCGFCDQPAFTRAFQRSVGVSPGRWRREQGH